MKCPYCGEQMLEGKLHAVGMSGPALRWNDEKQDLRLNEERRIVSHMNGDRISGYRCPACKKIILSYKEK